MRRFVLLLFAIFLSMTAVAQLEVKEGSFKEVPGFVNINPDENYQTDDNDLPFAVVKVRTENINDKQRRELKFSGNGGTFIMLEYKDGEVWVYLTAKYADYLKISHPNLSSTEFALPYDLKPKCGYEMTLVNKSPNIDKNNYLIVKADQQNAKIYIDDELMGTGYASKVVSIGEEHRYKVNCDDYFPKEGLVYFDKREDKEISVNLEPNFGYITIKSEPSGADVYVDGEKVGVTPYLSEQIQLGRRRVELKKTGYEPYAKVVTIKADEDENTQLGNVKLTAVRVPMGILELSSNPTGAVITINGRQYGQTPQTLTDFEVGTYTVYFSKEGYQNLSQTVEIKDGKKETLAVTMTQKTVPQPQVSTTPVVSNTSVSNNYSASNSSNGVFSVSSSKKVQFSKGNLQYQASTKTWRFAEHQWDVIGNANKNISSSYNGWIDLFGWGTSGYNGKNPWMTSTTSTDYGNGEKDIAGTNYDWGIYNTISNGGEKKWRTLNKDEWFYVFNRRQTSSGIRYAKAIVNGVNGIILLPDNWEKSIYILMNTNKYDAEFRCNQISKLDWISIFEVHGAVFLPAAGRRKGSTVEDVGCRGDYWSTTSDGFNGAYNVLFQDGYWAFFGVDASGFQYRSIGQSVRLVCPAEN